MTGWTSEKNREWLKRKWQELIFNFGGICENCGTKTELQFAHRMKTLLDGRGRGKNKRYYDILKHPASYRLLCETCHTIFDNKEEGVYDISK